MGCHVGRAIASKFGRHNSRRRAPTRGAPTDSFCPGEGTHKGRPYRFVWPWGGHPQGAPLPIRFALGRAPTRGAPTDSFGPGEGTHKGRPYRFVWPWGGRPQGAPLLVGRFSIGPGEGAHKGRPYRFVWPWGGRPQGVSCPYRFVWPWGGHPQGVGKPLPIRLALGRARPTRGAPTDSFGPGNCSRAPTRGAPTVIRLALGRAPTRGAPTDSFGPGKGTHKGRPY